MQIGIIAPETDCDLNALMGDVALRLAAAGLRLAGVVQVNAPNPGRARCHMDLRLLPDGAQIRISQDLGNTARGCRLDPGGLELAVAGAEARMAAGADVLVVNRFGKQECDGRGFRPLIAEAVAQGVPVLIAVSPAKRAAFLDFTGGEGTLLPPDPEAAIGWAQAAVAAAAV